ncbi:L,D-transpeptidase family protein [Sphingomonas qomolangmaensis]|uniref:L,D-transpeptidase family protein n=1 Tax=Sphingomonas qomolangmaensis TaxID=2918765 RepID=A0ABY5LDS1_9SPHN|nr:L,D-transpeptidase family protein [Sphingomonas qomolangmaensis]UUL82861.1 L,D-transpeptidase family protein [Sphingomonas qomolangmaensis]
MPAAPPARIIPPAMQTTPLPPSIPVPMVQPVAPLPVLTPVQATQLAALLEQDGAVQGLRSVDAAVSIPQANDALVRAALDHAHAVHAGRLDTADFQEDWALRPAAYDPRPAFAKAVAEDRIAQWFAALPPPWAGYDGLRAGLTRYRGIVTAGGWQAIPAGADLSMGSKGARVAALRKRLAIEDPEVVATGDSFDATLKAAVQRAQRRYGLNPTGTVSTQTMGALNVPARDRVRQIMANMERWRWLPHELPKNRIQVNIAAAVLTVFEGDSPVMSMKAVTGKPGGGETPMLQSTIHSVVLNPPWNVPSSIANRELFPKGDGYLKANNFRIIGEGPNRRLQQASGDTSALGRFKFDFDNPFAVYLHDTPAQAGFSRFDRLASHGCIRLEKPAELAKLLLRDVPEWSEAAIDEQVTTTTKTVRARLNTPVQVYLLYWTAFASANGQMSFRADPYKWDAVLADKIERRSAAQVASR